MSLGCFLAWTVRSDLIRSNWSVTVRKPDELLSVKPVATELTRVSFLAVAVIAAMCPGI